MKIVIDRNVWEGELPEDADLGAIVDGIRAETSRNVWIVTGSTVRVRMPQKLIPYRLMDHGELSAMMTDTSVALTLVEQRQ